MQHNGGSVLGHGRLTGLVWQLCACVRVCSQGKFVAGTALVTAMVHTHGEGGGLGISVSMRKGHIATALACLGLAGLVDEHLESDSDDEPSRAVARKRVRAQGAGDGDAGDDASVDAACDAATAETSDTAPQAEAATKKRRCGDVAGAEQ